MVSLRAISAKLSVFHPGRKTIKMFVPCGLSPDLRAGRNAYRVLNRVPTLSVKHSGLTGMDSAIEVSGPAKMNTGRSWLKVHLVSLLMKYLV